VVKTFGCGALQYFFQATTLEGKTQKCGNEGLYRNIIKYLHCTTLPVVHYTTRKPTGHQNKQQKKSQTHGNPIGRSHVAVKVEDFAGDYCNPIARIKK